MLVDGRSYIPLPHPKAGMEYPDLGCKRQME
jgi:hypothetical protein